MIATVAIAGFGIAGLCAVYRLARGPALADRVIAVEVAVVSLMAAVTVDAARRGDPTFLVALVVLALVGLAGPFAAGRYLERDTDPGEAASEPLRAGRLRRSDPTRRDGGPRRRPPRRGQAPGGDRP